MALLFAGGWHSLNGRLRLCGAVAIMGIAAAVAFSFVSSWRAAYDDVYEYFRGTEAEMSVRLAASLDDIQRAVRNAGYSIAVQRFLLSNNPETVIMNYGVAGEHVSNTLNASEYCRNIYLQNEGGRYLRANRYRITEIRQGIAGNASGIILNRPLFDVRRNKENRDELYFYFPVYNILWTERTNRIICAAACDMSAITSSLPFTEGDPGGAILLLYKNRIVSSSRDISAEEREALLSAVPGQGRARIRGKSCLTIKVSLPETLGRGNSAQQFWDCIYFIPESAVFSRIFSLMNRGLFMLAAVLLLIILILALLIHSVNTGVWRLVEDLNVLEYRQKHVLRKPRLKELELISRSVGLMLERINGAMRREQEINEKLLAAVTAQAQAEFMSYRTQINPHFLFNTLECMRAMAHSSGREGASLETMISSMSRMFRYSIYAKPMVSLSLEIEHARNFMRVMNIRSGGRYTLKERLSKEAADRLVPSMLLQPLVENSISHGFAGRSGGNCVMLLKASLSSEGLLRLRFTDNGAGMEKEELEALMERLEKTGGGSGEVVHALHNIRRRMRLCFGEGFSFDIRSRRGHYTIIEMLIPAGPELAIPEIK
ncbi:MAG: histidine kinase [Treponema sp.]|jgi:two-component system sensor histidine kinase YesM|nr:histidine kinase [Treponema sp.]